MRRSTSALMATGLVGALFIAAPGLAGPEFKNKYDDVERWFVCYDDSSEGTTEYSSLADAQAADDGEGHAGYVGYDAPLKMWPPNHKMQTTTFHAVPADDYDATDLMTSGTHDEYSDPENATGEMNGSGNTDGDVGDMESFDASAEYGADSLSTQHDIRSERSGRGDGRTYWMDVDNVTFTSENTEGGAASCDWIGGAEYDVEVPHDMGKGAENKKVHEPGDPEDE